MAKKEVKQYEDKSIDVEQEYFFPVVNGESKTIRAKSRKEAIKKFLNINKIKHD